MAILADYNNYDVCQWRMIVLNSHVDWGLHEARGYEGCIHKAEEAK